MGRELLNWGLLLRRVLLRAILLGSSRLLRSAILLGFSVLLWRRCAGLLIIALTLRSISLLWITLLRGIVLLLIARRLRIALVRHLPGRLVSCGVWLGRIELTCKIIAPEAKTAGSKD